MCGLKQSELSVGMSLPALRRLVTQEHISLYAEASGDFNPIHIDPAFAKETPLGGTIAHGMLILAYVSELMTDCFGRDWLTTGELSARFKAPARPGDTITASGKIAKLQKQDGFISIGCDVICQNQKSEPVIVGETKVRVKTQ